MVEIQRLEGIRWGEAEAWRVLEAWQGSGLSMAAFAREFRLGLPRLRWWQSRLRREARAPLAERVMQAKAGFVPVVVRGQVGVSNAAVRIRIGEVMVEVNEPTAVPPEWLSMLIAAMTNGGGR